MFSIHCYISFTLLWLSDDSYLSVTTFSILCTFKLQPPHICHSLPSFYIWGQCYHCTPCSLVTICNFPYFHLSAPLLPDYISPCLLLVVSPQFENQPRLTPLTSWLNWSSWPSSIFTFVLLPCHTPHHSITSIPPYLWNQDTWFQEWGCNT